MKGRTFAFVLAAVFSANALAADTIIATLASESGLTNRQVKMLVGARSGHAAYPASFDQVERQFVRAIGRKRYDDLLARRPVAPPDPERSLASVTVLAPIN